MVLAGVIVACMFMLMVVGGSIGALFTLALVQHGTTSADVYRSGEGKSAAAPASERPPASMPSHRTGKVPSWPVASLNQHHRGRHASGRPGDQAAGEAVAAAVSV